MSTVIFGIKNCDTVKKARRWLDENNISYTFSDFRDEQPNAERIRSWIEILGLDSVLNKRSTTYRQLDAKDKESTEVEHWIPLIETHVTLIKRPLLKHEGQLQVGFSEKMYKDIFNV